MKLKYSLHPGDIVQIIKNVKTSSNDLVKRVSAGETKYANESKKLINCGEEEFCLQRDKLIEALNLYESTIFTGAWGMGPQIGEMDKENLNYKLFHSELKELKNEERNLTLKATGLVLGTVGLFTLTGFVAGTVIAGVAGFFGGMGISGSTIFTGKRIAFRSKKFLPHHFALRSYASILKKSKKADKFMDTLLSFKETYSIKYEDSEVSKLYENNAEEFIDYFSGLKEVEEKEGILRLVYDSECKNEDVISWLDKNESGLVRTVGLDL